MTEPQFHCGVDAGGREHDARCSSMPRFATVGSSAASADRISQSPEAQNSLVAGKNAGNFAESAVIFENPSRKHLRSQLFTDEFPTQTEQGIFFARAGN
jgi:hypothetical protein